MGIVSPAEDRSVASQPAGVLASAAHRLETLAGRGKGSAILLGLGPTHRGAVAAQSADVLVAAADEDQLLVLGNGPREPVAAAAPYRPSALRPQVCRAPALTETKVSSSGTSVCRSKSFPQQVTLPSSSSPQVCPSPAVMETKVRPPGGVERPSWFDPQQRGEPSSVSPQACSTPTLITLNLTSAGGEARPNLSSPQQMTVPSARRAQVCWWPLLMAVRARPGGGEACP